MGRWRPSTPHCSVGGRLAPVGTQSNVLRSAAPLLAWVADRETWLSSGPNRAGGGVHHDGARGAMGVFAVVRAVDGGVEQVPLAAALDEKAGGINTV